MVKLDDYLDPFEKIIWRGTPDKKAMMLWAFGGVPFALFFIWINVLCKFSNKKLPYYFRGKNNLKKILLPTYKHFRFFKTNDFRWSLWVLLKFWVYFG